MNFYLEPLEHFKAVRISVFTFKNNILPSISCREMFENVNSMKTILAKNKKAVRMPNESTVDLGKDSQTPEEVHGQPLSVSHMHPESCSYSLSH